MREVVIASVNKRRTNREQPTIEHRLSLALRTNEVKHGNFADDRQGQLNTRLSLVHHQLSKEAGPTHSLQGQLASLH